MVCRVRAWSAASAMNSSGTVISKRAWMPQSIACRCPVTIRSISPSAISGPQVATTTTLAAIR